MPTPQPQHTLARSATVKGLGLFSGTPVTVTFHPAPDDHGIVFVRTDLGNAAIPATIENIARRPRRTALRNGEAVIETTEHLMAALAGLRIDNALIHLDAMELPGFDGSALPYVEALREAGLQAGTAARKTLVLSEPVIVRNDDAMIAAVPSPDPGMQVIYELNYTHPVIGRQVATFDLGVNDKEGGDFASEIAPARTFSLEHEARAMQNAGIGTHLTERDVLVLGEQGPLGGNAFRFNNEPVRHKTLDLIGDLYLLGVPVQARIVANKSGHALNQALAREMAKRLRQQEHQHKALSRNLLDIRKLQRILPHRYPMLLVDRVLEIDGDRRVLGVKNVTINEPFFQGHYPGTPIMPGVLVVEAMAQLSGVLIGQKLENQGKLAVLLSLDRVKLRRPVVPGDQLMLEAETARMRTSIAHVRCRAYVGQDLAAEAEIKFMIVRDSLEG